jgi:hypothetical protein
MENKLFLFFIFYFFIYITKGVYRDEERRPGGDGRAGEPRDEGGALSLPPDHGAHLELREIQHGGAGGGESAHAAATAAAGRQRGKSRGFPFSIKKLFLAKCKTNEWFMFSRENMLN